MKALRYKLTVYDGLIDWNHSGGHEITEIYIPELEIVANIQGGGNIFKDKPTRYEKEAKKITEITISDDDAHKMETFVVVRDGMKQLISKYIGESK